MQLLFGWGEFGSAGLNVLVCIVPSVYFVSTFDIAVSREVVLLLRVDLISPGVDMMSLCRGVFEEFDCPSGSASLSFYYL